MSTQDVSKLWRFVSGPISEDGGKTLSLGRIAFWVVFAIAIRMWLTGQELLDSHENLLWLSLAYNFGKKGVDIMKFRAQNGKPPVVSP